MLSSEQRPIDRISCYTMKTSGVPPSPVHAHPHSRTNSQSFFTSKPTNTPLSSPRSAYSVGQSYAPKLSPGLHRTAAQDARTPSPNYFGLSIEPAADPRDTSLLPKDNWSPPTSSVKSFAAALPKQLPLDANPDFEAFRRQVDANRGKIGFSLNGTATAHTPLASTPSTLQRPRPPRWHTHGSDVSDGSLARPPGVGLGKRCSNDMLNTKSNAQTNSMQDSAYGSGDSKRNSEVSLNPPPRMILNMGRHESPASFETPFAVPTGAVHSTINISNVDERHPRLSLVHPRADPPSPGPMKHQQQRAETVPAKLESGSPAMISPAQLRDLIAEGDDSEILLLDLRVSPQFAQARVRGALNLCIPTTLLKRATFNLQKLQHTFHADADQERFANWRNTSHLVVYDAFSSDKRDALSAMNMIKKFTSEGYTGSANILRGGFNGFAAAFPDLVDRSHGGSSPSLSLGGGSCMGNLPMVAPVIGGVMLPTATANPSPFFNNIRQNQDLVDGVGQIEVGVPPGLDKSRLPLWLKEAVESNDHGKKVSDKFLSIEVTEQSRMRDAYSVITPVTRRNSQAEAKIQLSGIEQGGKNRYKDILPFEHARVRLQGRPDGTGDYVNASHIQASRSYKRYIASQGPLPATFEDFWSVIWDQDVRVIVMLTAESEGGQLKCHPYWKGNDFGPIKLRALSEKKVSLDLDKHRADSNVTPTPAPSSNGSSTGAMSQAEMGRRRANTTTTLGGGSHSSSQSSTGGEIPYVIIRKFALSHASQPFAPIREITHLHYPTWPDFGAPAQPSHLLALVELANVIHRAALPLDVPGALATTRRGSNGGASSNLVQRAGERSAGASPKGGDNTLPLSWYDAPESNEHARPMLVHCSAGCGRTGAFCTVDSVIDMLKRQRLCAVQRANRKIENRERRRARQSNDQSRAKRQTLGRDWDGDIAMDDEIDPLVMMEDPRKSMSGDESGHSADSTETAVSKVCEDRGIDTSWLNDEKVDLIARTVEDFRGQRLSMVQSLRQFVLCYETVLEWIGRLQERGGSVDAKGRLRSGSLAM